MSEAYSGKRSQASKSDSITPESGQVSVGQMVTPVQLFGTEYAQDSNMNGMLADVNAVLYRSHLSDSWQPGDRVFNNEPED